MVQHSSKNSGEKGGEEEKKRGVVLVGGGRFAQSILRTIPETIRAVLLRDVAKGKVLEVLLRGVPVIASLEAIDPDSYDIVWIVTADTSLREVAEMLAHQRRDWSGITALHSSGATSAGVLGPLADCGATIFALHPNGSFTGAEAIPSGLVWSISESEHDLLPVVRRLIGDRAPQLVRLSNQYRTLYHAAASVAANYSVTLFAIALDLYRRAGIPETQARRIVAQFIAASAERGEEAGPHAALTGPISRGDGDVVAMQGEAVRRLAPEYSSLFTELAVATARLAGRDDEEEWRKRAEGKERREEGE